MTVNIARRAAGQFAFLDARREASLDLHASPTIGWGAFVLMGAEHILSGPDHLLFLIALLALSRSLWSTVKIVTGFTVAHSITLSLATLGWVELPSNIVEPFIAASIVWVAVENLIASQSDSRRWLLATSFGLVHGLGFASALLELGLPRGALVPALIGFNVGVEIGQLLFVAIAVPLITWASRPGRLEWLPKAMSLGAAGFGMVWLIQRVFFSP
jgi:hydrogenase/urease accessory protein HupE